MSNSQTNQWQLACPGTLSAPLPPPSQRSFAKGVCQFKRNRSGRKTNVTQAEETGQEGWEQKTHRHALRLSLWAASQAKEEEHRQAEDWMAKLPV